MRPERLLGYTARLLLACSLPGALAALAVLPAVLGAQTPEKGLAGRLVVDTVHGAALEGNLLGDPADREVAVYLPPSYDVEPDRRYPVVYLLPPFDGSPRTWTRAWPGLFGPRSGVAVMDSVLAAGGAREMIVVMPDGRNRYRGSYFANSPVSGGWEDFLVRDVVGHVDGTYRTLPRPDGRGLAGHSMGGDAALRVAMARPETFGAVYALSPCCLAGYGDVPEEVWERVLSYETFDELDRGYDEGGFFDMTVMAAAAWISPDPDRPPFFVALPFELAGGELRRDDDVAARWAAATVLARVDERADVLRGLRGLALDHGNRESAPSWRACGSSPGGSRSTASPTATRSTTVRTTTA